MAIGLEPFRVPGAHPEAVSATCFDLLSWSLGAIQASWGKGAADSTVAGGASVGLDGDRFTGVDCLVAFTIYIYIYIYVYHIYIYMKGYIQISTYTQPYADALTLTDGALRCKEPFCRVLASKPRRKGSRTGETLKTAVFRRLKRC